MKNLSFKLFRLFGELQQATFAADIRPSSSSAAAASYIFHGVGPFFDPFRSHVSRSLFKGLP